MSATSTLRRPGPSGSRPLPGPAPHHRRRRVLAVVAAVLVLLLAVAAWLVGWSSVLATRQVQVTGTRTLTPAQVRDAARVPLGMPLARQDTAAAAARVAALAPVRTVRVTRDWPGTLVVAVQEREPVLAVRQPGGYALIDTTGTPYLTVASVPRGVALAEVDPADTALLSEVGVVARALPVGLRAKVATVQARSADGIRLRLTDGDTVVWGSWEQSDLKARVLVALLKRPAVVYDVSAPQSPALR